MNQTLAPAPAPLTLARRAGAFAIFALMVAGSFAMWLGAPLGWLWLASHVFWTTTPTMGGFALVAAGILGSMVVIVHALAWLDHRHTRLVGAERVGPDRFKAVRAHDGLRPPRVLQPGILDVVMLAGLVAALVLAALWFAFEAGSPV